MAFTADYIKYELDGYVATISLNRPERLNALGWQLQDELAEAWEEAIGDDGVRCIILTGEGRIFSAGRDIKEQVERGAPRGRHTVPKAFNYLGNPETDKPIVAAVRGGAWGHAWRMCCGCDIVVAADDARFAFSEVPTGIIGPAPVPILNNLPWLPGSELVLRGHQISAQRAYELGLVNHVVPSDQVLNTARELAEEIAGLPPVHVRVTKQQLMMARPRPSAYQMDIALDRGIAELVDLEDTKEAATAFAEKRKPIFKGR